MLLTVSLQRDTVKIVFADLFLAQGHHGIDAGGAARRNHR